MAEGVLITIEVDDKGTPVIKQTTVDLEELNDETAKGGKAGDESAKGSKKASGGFKGMAGASKLAAAGVAAAAAAAVAATAAIAGLAAVAIKGVDAYREQEEVNRALRQSFAASGLAGEELSAALEQTNAAVANLAKATNFGDEQLLKMSSTFLKVSGESEVSQESLSLMADLAVGMGVSAEQGAKLYAQAMKGDLPTTLSRTTNLTRDQIAAINAMEDPTERAAAANEALSSAFGGMASNINPTYRAIKNLDDAQGDLLQKIGEVIVESGAFAPVIEGVANAFNGLEGWIEANKETLQGYIFDGVQIAIEWTLGLMDTLIKMGPVFGAVIPYVQQVGENFNILVSSIKIVARTALAFRSAVISGVVNVLDAVLEGIEKAAGFFGRELPAGLGETRKLLQGVATDMQEDVIAQLDAAGEETAKIGDAIQRSAENWGEMDVHTGKFVAMVNGARDAVDGIADRVAEARDNIGKTVQDAGKVGGGGGGGEGGGVADPNAQAEADAARQIQLAEEVAAVRIRAIEAADAAEKVRLETQARVMEIEAQQLPAQQRRLELLRVEQAEEQELARIKQEAVMAEIAAAELEQKIADERTSDKEREIAMIQARNAALFQGFDQVIPGIEKLGANLLNIRDLQWGTAEATEAAGKALSGMAEVGGTLADIITKDRKKAAAIEAAFNAAAAIGNFAAYAATGFTAQPLLLASVQHGIAAAQYAAIAGGGGGGGGGARRGGGGAGGSSGGMRTSGRDAVTAEREAVGQRQQVFNVSYDFSGSTNLESSPQIQRRISDATRQSDLARFVAGDVRGG